MTRMSVLSYKYLRQTYVNVTKELDCNYFKFLEKFKKNSGRRVDLNSVIEYKVSL